MPLPDLALALAAKQHGVLSRDQLLAAGVSRETLRWRIGRDWRLVLPGVYALQTGLPSQEQRLVAAQLVAGERLLAGGNHGRRPARLDVMLARAADPFARTEATAVAAGRLGRRRRHVPARRTSRRAGPLRLGCLPRAVVDAAAQVPEERRARALMIEAVQRRLVRLDDLEHWVDARGTPRLRAAATPAGRGCRRSLVGPRVGSARAHPHLERPAGADGQSDPPGPGGEPLTSPDVWFDDVGMAVLVQSRQFHSEGLDWDATVVAGSDLSAARVVVVGVTPEALARDPGAQLLRVEHAHAAARRSGTRAPVTASARPTVPVTSDCRAS